MNSYYSISIQIPFYQGQAILSHVLFEILWYAFLHSNSERVSLSQDSKADLPKAEASENAPVHKVCYGQW